MLSFAGCGLTIMFIAWNKSLGQWQVLEINLEKHEYDCMITGQHNHISFFHLDSALLHCFLYLLHDYYIMFQVIQAGDSVAVKKYCAFFISSFAALCRVLDFFFFFSVEMSNVFELFSKHIKPEIMVNKDFVFMYLFFLIF